VTRRAIVTDIEGTTSSISFVKDVLFPYARRQLPAFVREHGNEPAVRRWLDAAAVDAGGICTDDTLIEMLQGWIDTDYKHTALKALQGMIWVAGYDNGDYAAHIYPDAAMALRRWHEQGHALFVFSSGSVPAQKLLFGHTTAGDLTPLFSGYFDTEIGGKREAGSYRRILQAIERPAAEVIFLSDVVEELDAARDAGLDTVLLDRPQDYPQPREGDATHDHRRVLTFDQIDP
jgi:enolase-phosphatase E1